MRIAQAFLTRGLPLVRGGVAARAARNLTVDRPLAPLRSTFLPVGGAGISPRLFSSAAKRKLIEMLASKPEEEGVNRMDLNFDDEKKCWQKDWKFVEDGATVNMFMNEKNVRVSFHCQDILTSNDHDTSDDDMDDDDDDSKEKFKNYDEDEVTVYAESLRFCVTVSNSEKTLVINCISDVRKRKIGTFTTTLKIEGVFTTTSAPNAIHANRGNLTQKNDYRGPEFSELASDLQDGFVRYLQEECGVDSNMTMLVAVFSNHRKPMQYQQFLKDTQSIIS